MTPIHDLGTGFVITIELTFLAFVLATVLGTVLTAMRIGRVGPLKWAATGYVELVRNTPVLVLLFLFVYGLPAIGLTYSLFISTAVTVGLYEAAFICETLRAGVNTVPQGDAEAARAIGLTGLQVSRLVVIPQAARNVIQPLGNVFIATALNTSVAAVVGLAGLTGAAQRLNIRVANPLIFAGAGAGYILIALTGGLIAGTLDRRMRFAR